MSLIQWRGGREGEREREQSYYAEPNDLSAHPRYRPLGTQVLYEATIVAVKPYKARLGLKNAREYYC